MKLKTYSYTVGVKRGVFFKKYRRVVKNHFMNDIGGAPFGLRLVLKFEDGSEISLAGVDDADIKMYPDFAQAMKAYENDKIKAAQASVRSVHPPTPEPAIQTDIHELARQRGIV